MLIGLLPICDRYLTLPRYCKGRTLATVWLGVALQALKLGNSPRTGKIAAYRLQDDDQVGRRMPRRKCLSKKEAKAGDFAGDNDVAALATKWKVNAR